MNKKVKIYTGGIAIIPEGSNSDIEITGELVETLTVDETQEKNYKKPKDMDKIIDKHKALKLKNKKTGNK